MKSPFTFITNNDYFDDNHDDNDDDNDDDNIKRSGISDANKSKSAEELMTESRRALYGTLPLIATFGMQHRENQIKRILSRVSLSSLENLQGAELEDDKPSAVLLSDVDVDEIIMTFPMMMAALVAMISQFLVGALKYIYIFIHSYIQVSYSTLTR